MYICNNLSWTLCGEAMVGPTYLTLGPQSEAPALNAAMRMLEWCIMEGSQPLAKAFSSSLEPGSCL